MTLDLLGQVSTDTRNPFISMGMEVLAQAENGFPGIPTIRCLMKEAESPFPRFETYRGAFKAFIIEKKARPSLSRLIAYESVFWSFVRRHAHEKSWQQHFQRLQLHT